MTGGPEVLHGVFVFGGVAASDIATSHAHSKLGPGIPERDTVFANEYPRFGYPDLIEMRTFLFPEGAGKDPSNKRVDYTHTTLHGPD